MLGRYQESLAVLDKAIELDPQYVWAYNERAIVHSDNREYERAIADFDKAIELDPKNTFAHAHKGSTLRMLRRYPEALAALNKAIELDPRYVWAYNERANVHSDNREYEQAIVDFDKAVELDPVNRFAHVRRASIYHDDLFQYATAYQDLKNASELRDGQAEDSIDLAEAALTSDRFDEAYDLARKLLAESEKTDINTFDVSDRLALRFIAISTLLLEGNTAEAKLKLAEFVRYYKSATPNLHRDWNYSGTRHFIEGRAMDGVSKRIILDMIKLLEAPPEIQIEQIEELVSTLK